MTLEEIKDKSAKEVYGEIGWFMLTDTQKASLVNIVATEYALYHVQQTGKSTLEIINQSINQ